MQLDVFLIFIPCFQVPAKRKLTEKFSTEIKIDPELSFRELEAKDQLANILRQHKVIILCLSGKVELLHFRKIIEAIVRDSLLYLPMAPVSLRNGWNNVTNEMFAVDSK